MRSYQTKPNPNLTIVEVEVEVDPFYCIIGCRTAIKVATVKNKVILTLDLSLLERNTCPNEASGGLQSKPRISQYTWAGVSYNNSEV